MSQALKRAALKLPPLQRLTAERDALRAQVTDLQRANRRLSTRLDRTTGELAQALSLGPAQRELGYVFVLTYGRSGSTLLQGLLNSIPGYLVRGENRASVYHLYEFHSTCVREARRVRKPDLVLDQTDPFFGMDQFPARVSLDRLRRVATDTLLRPEPDTRVTGFKEIRWYQDDVADFVAFLRDLFPGARFVVNTRDHEAVLQSRWWARTPDAANRLAGLEEKALGLVETLGDAAFHVHFDDYVADVGSLDKLFAWLGEDFDPARLEQVMAVRHSF